MSFSSDTQNSRENLERLSAQRFLYSSAKTWIALQYISATVLSIAGIAGALKYGFRVSVASGILLLLDKFLVDRLIRSRIKEAALIQESFDCSVLGLEWSKTKCGSSIQPEEIHSYSKRMSGTVESQRLQDWYPKVAFSLPQNLGRIICQRANVVWNLTGRKKVAFGLSVLAVFSVIGLILSMAISDIEASKWLYAIFVPALPFLNRLWDALSRTTESVSRMTQLQSRILDIWNEALSGTALETKISERSREFQSELFDFRSREIPVFDKLYWSLRTENEISMNQTAEALVAEAVLRLPKDSSNKKDEVNNVR